MKKQIEEIIELERKGHTFEEIWQHFLSNPTFLILIEKDPLTLCNYFPLWKKNILLFVLFYQLKHNLFVPYESPIIEPLAELADSQILSKIEHFLQQNKKDDDISTNLLLVLSEISSKNSEAHPLLLFSLKEPDLAHCSGFFYAVRAAKEIPAIALPFLIELLQSPHESVQDAAVMALDSMRELAKEALPDLKNLRDSMASSQPERNKSFIHAAMHYIQNPNDNSRISFKR